MLHPDTRLVWVDDVIGYGLVATRAIPRGTILWTLDALDLRLTPRRVEALGEAWWPILERYSYVDAAGQRILCWDFGRFMNHSCEPVSLSPGTSFEMAVRDLAPGDAITCDYATLNLETALECLCGSPVCRRLVRSSDAASLWPEWDRLLRGAIVDAPAVAQPLLPFVAERALLGGWAARPESLPSARKHVLRRVGTQPLAKGARGARGRRP